MTLRPGSSVTGASAVNDINPTKPVVSKAGSGAAVPADGIRFSTAFETLTLLNSQQAVKVARVGAAVQSGTYQVNAAAVGKSMVEAALS